MELFFGAFTADWERKRAAFLHDLSLGKRKPLDDEEFRRRSGGSAGCQDFAKGNLSSRGLGRSQGARARSNRPERSMKARFTGLATGSQPAVVKMASFGGSGRLGAMVNYVSRGGEIAVENERGEELRGRDALSAVGGEWDHLMKNRAESRDVGSFQIEVTTKADESDRLQEFGRELIKRSVGDRSFAFAISARADRTGYDIEGQVVLRSPGGERLTADAKATEIVQARLDAARQAERGDDRADATVRFRFTGYGNGTDHGTSRLRALVERHQGRVEDATGKPIGDAKAAGDLVQQEWREQLHSRKPRDVMHLILSARAGTDVGAFNSAAREFLATEFGGYRYVFSIHDPSNDPKSQEAGGKRPHVHVHAIVAMRSDFGDRVETTIQSFRRWRETMAEQARAHGIKMEMTDRRERASAAAYSRGQVRPVNTIGRTEHEGTSSAAQRRYDNKRSDAQGFARTERSRSYTVTVHRTWNELSEDRSDDAVTSFARTQNSRLETGNTFKFASRTTTRADVNSGSPYQTTLVKLSEIISESNEMRQMSRSEFEAYEKRVETALFQAERSTPAEERADFDEIATAAREHVNFRRDLVDYWEEQATHERSSKGYEPVRDGSADDDQADSSQRRWDEAVAEHGLEATREANRIFLEIERAREAIERAEYGDKNPKELQDLKQELDTEIGHAAKLGAAGNTLIREAAETDDELRDALQTVERERQAETRKRDHVAAVQDGRSLGHSTTEDAGENVPASATPETKRVDQQQANEQQARVRSDTNQTDPAKQHVSRLDELQRERDEREARDRDDPDR